eukprot:GHVR01153719.1.p1 GENE.GHVR01153719.1~~GHVR01153719.1.p1  ORF type:complete len:119 (+),score=6.43 GHVR01153719.1:94-450(+)
MKKFRENHPDCIPIYFVKHAEASSNLKPAISPFILFGKHLKIEQAMYNLFQQIQQKGLYFFCLREERTGKDQKKNKIKYVVLRPGATIEEVYNRYGRDDLLTLIYADTDIGMGGINKM